MRRLRFCNVGSKSFRYSIDSISKDYGEKEKQKEKLKIKNYDCDKKVSSENKKDDEELIKCISKFKILYEQNVGLINGIVSEWLFEICETIDYELIKKDIEIATDRGKCNKVYINGILNQWSDNNIKSIEDLKAYEVGIKNRGDKYGKYSNNYRKNEYTTWCEGEMKDFIKPTAEEIAAVEREFGEFRNRH